MTVICSTRYNLKKVDYIIVGFGIAGATLALRLRMRGQSVAVFNNDGGPCASRQAAGIFNPITGKVLSKTWMAETLFSELHDWYRSVEQLTGAQLIRAAPVYIPFRSVGEQNDWVARASSPEYKDFIQHVYTSAHLPNVHDTLGGMMLARSGSLDVNLYLALVARILREDGCYHNEKFELSALQSTYAHVTYKEWEAKAIVFCMGTSVNKVGPFQWLPMRALHGETIDVNIAYDFKSIVNRGVYVVPTQANTYRVGATYRHAGENEPTPAGRAELEEKLRGVITTPFVVIEHSAGSRPTSPDRRPILGQHPGDPKLWVFNGLGTKGISQAPYFSRVLADAILGTTELPPEVNISRFYPLYSKSRD